MWNLPLGYEIVLIIVLAAIIAWFLGRLLCKSKEYEVRAEKKALQAETEYLASTLEEKEKNIQELHGQIKNQQENILLLENNVEAKETVLQAVKKEQGEALEEAQQLRSYQVRFEELAKRYDEQEKSLLALTQEHAANKQGLSEKTDLLHHKDEEIALYKKKLALLDEEKTALQHTLNSQGEEKAQVEHENKLQAEKMMLLDNDLRARIAALEAELAQQRARVGVLQNENETLQQDNNNKGEEIKTLRDKLNVYLEAANSTNVKIAGMLKDRPA